MLEVLASLQVRSLADKARAAREARDRMLTGVREKAFGEQKPARGEHNPAAEIGLDVLPEADTHRTALIKALSELPQAALRELWALTLIGRGDYGLSEWDQALQEAKRLREIDVSRFMEQADLHDHLMKAAYELDRAYGQAS